MCCSCVPVCPSGPMVYGICYCPVSKKEDLKNLKVAGNLNCRYHGKTQACAFGYRRTINPVASSTSQTWISFQTQRVPKRIDYCLEIRFTPGIIMHPDWSGHKWAAPGTSVQTWYASRVIACDRISPWCSICTPKPAVCVCIACM